MRVAGIVLKRIRADKEANYRRVKPMIREAATNGAKIVCTTECFLDGYAIADKSIPLDQCRALGEPIPDGKYFQVRDCSADMHRRRAFLDLPLRGMFGPTSNDPIVQVRSREIQIHIVFAHPVEFLVTGPDGSILANTLLGDHLLIQPDEVGTAKDSNLVFHFDLPLRKQ